MMEEHACCSTRAPPSDRFEFAGSVAVVAACVLHLIIPCRGCWQPQLVADFQSPYGATSLTNTGDTRLQTLEMLLLCPPHLNKRAHEKNCVEWDTSADVCQSCDQVTFSAIPWLVGKGRHHCRMCGGTICDACSGALAVKDAVKLLLSSTAYTPPSHLHLNDDPILTCTVRVFTMDSAALGLGSSGCDCCTVRVFRHVLHSRMLLDPCIPLGC
jgi:hypothetical protein